MRHPKAHRIFAKSLPVNRKQFTLSMGQKGSRAAPGFFCVCFVLMESLLSDTLYEEQKVAFIRTLKQSVKHWSKYQLLFFINHLLWELTRIINECRSTRPYFLGPKYNVVKAFASRCYDLICWRAAKFGQRYGTDTLRKYIQDHETLPGIYQSARSIQSELRRNVKQYVVVHFVECGRRGCSKNGGHIHDSSKRAMKMCQQCKMTYYCSKKCQKRDWKDRHRQRCSVLRDYYCSAV